MMVRESMVLGQTLLLVVVLAAITAFANASRCPLDFQECSKHLGLSSPHTQKPPPTSFVAFFFFISLMMMTLHTHTHTQTAKGTEDAVFCNSFKELPLQVFFDVKTIDGQPFITCLFAPFSSSLRTAFSHLSFSPSHCRLSMTTQRY